MRRLLEWPTRFVPVDYHGDMMVSDRSVLAEHIAKLALGSCERHRARERPPDPSAVPHRLDLHRRAAVEPGPTLNPETTGGT